MDRTQKIVNDMPDPDIEKLLAQDVTVTVKKLEDCPSSSLFESEHNIFTLRLLLIRTGRINLLDKLVSVLYDQALKTCHNHASGLLFALKLNCLWHLGEIEKAHKFWEKRGWSNPVDEFDVLSLIYYSFIENTSGRFRKSLQCLTHIPDNLLEKQTLRKALDMDAKFVVTSWKIWCYNELNEVEINEKEMLLCLDALEERVEVCDRSKALLFLAVGVFYLNRKVYVEAEKYLLEAFKSVLSSHIEDYSWSNRISSALSVLYFETGRRDKGFEYLYKSFVGLQKHYGPVGWKIRVSRALWLAGSKNFAALLMHNARAEACEKGEFIYELWASIHLYEMGHLEKEKLKPYIHDPRSCECERATTYVYNILENENDIISSIKFNDRCVPKFLSAYVSDNGVVALHSLFAKETIDKLADCYDRVIQMCEEGDTRAKEDICSALVWIKEPRLIIGKENVVQYLISVAIYITEMVANVQAQEIEVGLRIFHKPPGGTETIVHQDQAYLSPAIRKRRFSLWVPLDKATVKNGCLYYALGSGRGGLLKHEIYPSDNTGKTLSAKTPNDLSYISFELNPGDALFHDSYVLHGAHNNTSTEPRRAFVINCSA